MSGFSTMSLPAQADVIAPDGSAVRILLQLAGGSLAHFELAPGQTSRAVTHRSVEEIWYFLQGQGEMWRKLGDQEEIVPVSPGVALTIPQGTHFQFRASGEGALATVAITMPPWPGEGEAYPVPGLWTPTVEA
jgi:mannose-6-phosphate isomerase-like protein (cupin superfamily)